MIGFLIRKTFYDLWDNLFNFALLNLGLLLSAMIPFLLPSVLPERFFLKEIVTVLGIFWCAVYISAAALSLAAVSDYGSFSFADLYRNRVKALFCGLAAGFIACFLFVLLTIIVPFYLALGNFTGLLLASLVFWIFLIIMFSIQFAFAVRARIAGSTYKMIKKCFIIFFDNPLFCIGTLILCVIAMMISVLTAFLFPGPLGIILLLDEALRLRLLKYDWLEAHPDISGKERRNIPWDTLLADEREKTGTRTLRNLIFPWKN